MNPILQDRDRDLDIAQMLRARGFKLARAQRFSNDLSLQLSVLPSLGKWPRLELQQFAGGWLATLKVQGMPAVHASSDTAARAGAQVLQTTLLMLTLAKEKNA